MSRPSIIPKKKVGAQPSVNNGVSASEVINLTAAGVSLECQSALVSGKAAARTALAKHRASITAELTRALEIVGGYSTNEVNLNPL